MKRYSTYEFYISQYGGSALGELAFEKAASKASAYIDRITFGRAGAYSESPEHELQMCTCEMAEAIKMNDDNTVNGRLLQSISNSGYTETYAVSDRETGLKSLHESLYEIARLYLPAELLSLGLGDD